MSVQRFGRGGRARARRAGRPRRSPRRRVRGPSCPRAARRRLRRTRFRRHRGAHSATRWHDHQGIRSGMDYEQPIGRRLSATHLQAEGLGQCRPEPARMECHLFWEPRLERALDFRGITKRWLELSNRWRSQADARLTKEEIRRSTGSRFVMKMYRRRADSSTRRSAARRRIVRRTRSGSSASASARLRESHHTSAARGTSCS